MTPALWMLFCAASCVVGGSAVAVLAIRSEQQRRRRLQDRMARVLDAYARAAPLTAPGRAGPRPGHLEWLAAASGRLFGYGRRPVEQERIRRWIVVAGTLVAARALSLLVEFFAGPALSLPAVPVAWILLSRAVFRWMEQRRRQALYAQFPDALSMVVRAVRVSIPLGEGIHTVAREAPAPTGPEFRLLYDRVAIGVTLEDALHEMAARNGLPEYRFFATALALQSRTGGGLSDALEGLADVIRRRLALRSRGRALASEAQMSIYILASLPFVAGGALALLTPAYAGRLFFEHACRKLLLLAIVLLCTGLVSMRVMIRKALS